MEFPQVQTSRKLSSYVTARILYLHASINFTAVEGGDNSSYAGSEAREVFINTSSDISGVNK